ncbi:hypothetical protein VPNG_08208 [Cytospora leucostoma]|uniref:Alpha/beta hydrolase fold-3 domain-containing protein n=1 Tax=Cytospora leucostoma TaxID=1230097 RepID=A0A423W7E8_9PEZI|nr:hypothetical protein VPNG_08208 [Cytospora leucostoma]
MAQLSLWAYWCLKVPVILLRILTLLKARAPLRRDCLLAETQYPVRRERLHIPSRDPGRFIIAELYLPPPPPPPSSSSSPASPPRPTPVLVNYHGSGFVLTGLLGTNSLFCARAAHDLGIPVLDADYRKAPEHPFPAALHDVEDVLHWVGGRSGVTGGGGGGGGGGNDDDRHFDASRVVLSGFSSGGALALAAASALRRGVLQASGVGIRGVVALEKLPPRDGISPMDPSVLDLFVDCYLPDRGDRADPRASPGRADPAEYPGTVAVLTCEGDRLAPEALALESRLRGCPSVRAVGTMLMGVGHGFDAGVEKGTLEWERREEMYALAVETVKGAIGEV